MLPSKPRNLTSAKNSVTMTCKISYCLDSWSWGNNNKKTPKTPPPTKKTNKTKQQNQKTINKEQIPKTKQHGRNKTEKAEKYIQLNLLKSVSKIYGIFKLL